MHVISFLPASFPALLPLDARATGLMTAEVDTDNQIQQLETEVQSLEAVPAFEPTLRHKRQLLLQAIRRRRLLRLVPGMLAARLTEHRLATYEYVFDLPEKRYDAIPLEIRNFWRALHAADVFDAVGYRTSSILPDYGAVLGYSGRDVILLAAWGPAPLPRLETMPSLVWLHRLTSDGMRLTCQIVLVAATLGASAAALFYEAAAWITSGQWPAVSMTLSLVATIVAAVRWGTPWFLRRWIQHQVYEGLLVERPAGMAVTADYWGSLSEALFLMATSPGRALPAR